jgi:hypothetical protein
MAKADLSELLKNRRTSDSADAPAEIPARPPVRGGGALSNVPVATAVEADSARSGAPLYLQLERKESRVRKDQLDTLSTVAKRLQRAKGTGGDRITDNTLIRVAIDMFLAQSDKAAGKTEAEILKSVTS